MSKKVYHSTVVDRLIEKYGVSRRYITMSINGDRTSETSTTIKRDYNKMLREVQAQEKQIAKSLKSL